MKRKGLITTAVSVGVFSLIFAGCGADSGTGTTTTVNNETASKTEVSASTKTDFDKTKAFEIRKKDANISAVFLGNELQPLKKADGETENIDTVWIYYDDNTFDQFANVNGKFEGFSAGTYEFVNGDDFSYEGENDNSGEIVIRRYLKYEDGKGVTDYSSEHTYNLETLAYHKAYPQEGTTGKKVVTVFAAPEKQKYVDKNGKEEMLDTTWLYFDDMTFEQFVLKDDKADKFSKGTYSFEDGGDFIYEEGDTDHGKITINRNEKYQDGKGLTDYSSTHTYGLNTLGFDQLYVMDK